MPEDPSKASGTRRMAAHKSSTRRGVRKPLGEVGTVEVVTSDEADASEVRRRVSGSYARKGLSLTWKIAVAIVGVTFLTGLLTFIVVYNKAVDRLNDEINAKGDRLVNTLASIDEEYWYTAIHWNDREAEFKEFLRNLDPPRGWEEKLETTPELRKAFVDVVTGSSRHPEVRNAVSLILGREDWYDRSKNTPEYKRFVEPFGPFGELNPLASLQEPGNEDVVDLGVVDVSKGTTNAPVILIKGRTEIRDLPVQKGGEKITVDEKDYSDALRKTRVRLFIRNPDPKSSHKFRYYAMLSLEKISDTKATLFWSVFLTVLVAVGLGVGIAMGLSTLITKPVKILMKDIQEVSAGNLDHETVPVSHDEIGMLASTFNKMTGALKTAHEQELEQKKMEHQLAIAREIQENLMPKKMLMVPGYDVGAFYRPSQEVGGDYYDFIEIDENHAGLIVADVSGKGVPGAIVMSMALAFIREEVDRTRNTSPMATLIRANKMLAQNIKKGMFVTALYCILDKGAHELKVASAGHNPLIVWRAKKGEIQLVNPKGIALGFDKGPVFERTVEEGRVALDHGDRIVAYTDGAVESMNAAHEEFGDKRFHQLVREVASRDANQALNLIVKALDEHKGEAPQHDDITLVMLRYL